MTCINTIVLGQSMKLYSALVSTKSIIIACGDLELHKYINRRDRRCNISVFLCKLSYLHLPCFALMLFLFRGIPLWCKIYSVLHTPRSSYQQTVDVNIWGGNL